MRADVLADVRDDVLAGDPELARAFAGFARAGLPLWARPWPWCAGSVLAPAAFLAAFRLVGPAALAGLVVVLLAGGLVAVALATGPADAVRPRPPTAAGPARRPAAAPAARTRPARR